jgi:succinate dehydrogenase / fumarate reductase cytochrome b subunit
VHEKRPVFLTLTQIQFPVTAIISILHRISGVLMFLLLPGILWFLQTSLTAQGFAQLNEFLQRPTGFLLAWVAISAWLFHLLAGVRHL